jgi:hypothetical protein
MAMFLKLPRQSKEMKTTGSRYHYLQFSTPDIQPPKPEPLEIGAGLVAGT